MEPASVNRGKHGHGKKNTIPAKIGLNLYDALMGSVTLGIFQEGVSFFYGCTLFLSFLSSMRIAPAPIARVYSLMLLFFKGKYIFVIFPFAPCVVL